MYTVGWKGLVLLLELGHTARRLVSTCWQSIPIEPMCDAIDEHD